MEKTIKPEPTKRGELCFGKKRKAFACVRESPLNHRREGFAIAPILYLLVLAGVASGVLFSNISQVLRSNINVTNATTAKSDISGAVTTLSATAILSADQTVFCPPGSAGVSVGCVGVPEKLVLFADVAGGDVAKLPISYALADDTGGPYEAGVFAAAAGIKQLDPWGHFYIYCRWENPRATADAPAIKVIAAGANATLETKCGDDTAKGDDQLNWSTVGASIQRAALWQDTGSAVEYGQTGNKVSVSDLGVITATGLIVNTATFGMLYLTNPLPIVSGGTAANNIVTARANLGSGTTGDSLFLAATATSARNTLGATAIGHYLLAGTALVADTASAARLELLGASAVGNDLFVAADAAAGRSVLGATTMGDYLFSSGVYVAATATAVRSTLLGAGAIGDAVFLSADIDTAQTALGATAVGKGVFMAATATAGRTALGGGAVGSPLFTAADQATAWSILGLTGTSGTLNVDITGEAGSVDGANITGTVPIAHGGTSSGTASGALDNLFSGDLSPGTALSVDRIGANSLDSGKMTNVVASGTYNQVEVDSAGRVTNGSFVLPITDRITDGVGESIIASATNGGSLIFSTASAAQMTLTATGSLGLGTMDPAEKLHVFGGNTRISGPSDGYRELQFATSTNAKRWVVAADDQTETGSGDTGSDFVLRRYTDAGVAATVLNIDRATGNATFAGSVAATGGFLGYFTGTFDGTYIGTITGNVLLGTDATHTNPQRASDVTTGLFSDAAQTVSVATNGTQRLIVTATGSVGIGTSAPAQALDVTGNINVSAITNGYYIANTKVLHQPVSDTTSIGLGASTLAAQTATNLYNTAVGVGALQQTTTGMRNTANGFWALYANTTGSDNVAVGDRALYSNTTGSWNTANGYQALYSNTTGMRNTANGHKALYSNTTGYNNTANGFWALYANTTGSANVAVGDRALYSNTTGSWNTANGYQALYSNTTGDTNTANGYGALSSTTSGNWNTAAGFGALYANTTGNSNTASGLSALRSNTTGINNTAEGSGAALYTNGSSNTAIGYNALLADAATANWLTGSYNTAIGQEALKAVMTTANNNTALGYLAGGVVTTGASNVIIGPSVASTTLTTGSSNILIGTSAAVDTPAAATSNWLNIGNTIYGDLSLGSVAIGAAAVTSGTSLDLSSRTDSLLLPKGTTAQQPVGVEGMVRYNTDLRSIEVYEGTTPAWFSLATSATAGSTMYLGADATHTSPSRSDDVTTGLFSDAAQTVSVATAGTERLRVTATGSVGIGTSAPAQALDVNGNINVGAITNGYYIANTKVLHQPASDTTSFAAGPGALAAQTATNLYNTAVGVGALQQTTTGMRNTANGHKALYSNTTGYNNTANGYGALASTTSGNWNTAAGFGALSANTTGNSNTASGLSALRSNTTGSWNTAEGSGAALYTNGSSNTAIGYNALLADAATANWLTGSYNTAIGQQALKAVMTTANNNTALGYYAGATVTTGASNLILGPSVASTTLTTGSSNILIGNSNAVTTPAAATSSYLNIGNAIKLDMTVVTATNPIISMPVLDNTSIGVGLYALQAQTATNKYNTAVGTGALKANTTGNSNTANGYYTLQANTTGLWNTANGYGALYLNTLGSQNTASGYQALYSTTTGSGNTASGYWSLYSNTTGSSNTASGLYSALYINGSSNTAMGAFALRGDSVMANWLTGSYNTAVGQESLKAVMTTANKNTALGYLAGGVVTTGASNVIIGPSVASTVLTTGSSNILIGTSAAVTTPAAATSSFLNIGNAIKLDMTAVTATNPIISMPALDNTSIGVGLGALKAQTATNKYNAAVGVGALYSNTTGSSNTANGYYALYSATTGTQNTASGYYSLYLTSTGAANTASGYYSLIMNTVGNYNAAYGRSSLASSMTGSNNTAYGSVSGGSITSGSNNTVLGYSVASTVLTTGSSNILIGTSVAVTTPAADTSSYLNIGNAIKLDMTAVTATNPIISMPVLDNTSIGVGLYALQAQTATNLNNTGVGVGALQQTTEGYNNTANGSAALRNNTAGYQNTANGYASLYSNTTGYNNTANGHKALYYNTTGAYNTANGIVALQANTTGNWNTSNGSWALASNTTGSSNAANGYAALLRNTTGSYNTAEGYYAAAYTNASSNTAVGYGALVADSATANWLTGSYNTAIGRDSLRAVMTTANNNTALGYLAGGVVTSGASNVIIGPSVASTTLTTGSSNILIGTSSAVDTPAAGTSNFLNIGGVINADMASQLVGINLGTTIASYPLQVGSTSGNGNGAYLTAAGVWTNASDRRIKENIRTVSYGIDTLMKLKPVAYEMIGTHEPQIGFIAQDVGEVVPEVVSVSREGRYGLSYGNMVAVVVKAMQELKASNDNQATAVAALEARVVALEAENKSLRNEKHSAFSLQQSGEEKDVGVGAAQDNTRDDDTRALLLLTIKIGGAVGLLLIFGLGACGVALLRQRKRVA
ncbi:MAG: tail fiber domain-containing protein [Bdellovibrionales bacterium]